jgi:hypothetical protein
MMPMSHYPARQGQVHPGVYPSMPYARSFGPSLEEQGFRSIHRRFETNGGVSEERYDSSSSSESDTDDSTE